MDIEKTFKQLGELGLQQKEFPENMTWDDYVEELNRLSDDDIELRKLTAVKRQEEYVEATTLEKILTSNFMVAKNTIDRMTLPKRIEMLQEINEYRSYLYERLEHYTEGIPKEDQISIKEFRAVLGRIKHVEILMNWLFGIV